MKDYSSMKKVLRATDDPEEMIAIGKTIYENNPDIYIERRKALLDSVIDDNMPGASKEEKTRMLFRSIYDYWMYGVTAKEEFSLLFYNKTHTEKEQYITFRSRFLYTSHLNDTPYAYELLEDKYHCFLGFRDRYLRDVICIETEADYPEFAAFVEKHPTFVVKPVGLGFGMGVHKQTVGPGAVPHEVFSEILQGGDAIREKYHIATHTKRFVLEELIDQSDEMGCLHPNSVNCVRLNTVMVDGKAHVFYPWLKVGRHGNFISNAGDDGIMVGIDPATGCCDVDASDEFNHRYEIHPDTKIRFRGFQIPAWDELLQLGDELARKLAPRINYVGWDMAYTNAGWSIMEGNSEAEFLPQIQYGRGLKREFEELIHWKPSVEYWWEDPVSTKIG